MDKLKQDAARMEERLGKVLKDQPVERNIDHALSQLVTAYEKIIFFDYAASQRDGIENKMWLRHRPIIDRYRKHITKFREANGKKKPVELRKLISAFTNFLKTASKFYRSFIQRLICHFSMSELEAVLRQLHMSYTINSESVRASPDEKDLIIRSVHRSLVILGDLSRYREEFTADKDKNWGPAKGYYNLAKKLLPDLGAPHNQLAVIARSSSSTVSSTYHLFRAVSVKEPFPEAGNNIEVGLKRFLKAKEKGNAAGEISRREEKMVNGLIEDFLTLHAKYAKGIEIPDQDAVQTDMILQLVSDLRERNLSTGMLNKLIFINIAAEYYFRCVVPENKKVPLSPFLKLNLETFNNLLLVFQPQLERAKSGNEGIADRLSAVGRRMLPGLRLYSRWLLNNHESVTRAMGDSMQLKQLWQTYADTLSILSSSFSVESLPRLDYPLEEDEEMIGFLPLVHNHSAEANWGPFLSGDESYKVHPNEEMLARVLALLEDCEELCSRPMVPITIIDGMITYQEDGNVVFTPSIGSRRHEAVEFSQSALPESFKPIAATLTGSGFEANAGSASISETGSYSLSARLDRMVDNLVGPRDDPIPERDEEEDEMDRSPDDDEEIVFVARNARHSSENRTPQSTPALKTTSSPVLPSFPPVPSSNQVNDLVDYVQTFSKRLEASSPSLPPPPPTSEPWGTLPSSTTYHTLSSLYYPPPTPVTRRINSPIFLSPWEHKPNDTPPAGQGHQQQGRG